MNIQTNKYRSGVSNKATMTLKINPDSTRPKNKSHGKTPKTEKVGIQQKKCPKTVRQKSKSYSLTKHFTVSQFFPKMINPYVNKLREQIGNHGS